MHHELIAGELQVLPPRTRAQAEVSTRLMQALLPVEQRAGVLAYGEAGYKISQDPTSCLQPDVSVLGIDRVRATPRSEYFSGAPELAIEIISPWESAADLDRKIQLMLRGGSMAVWVVYPQQREVAVHHPDGTSRRLTAADNLSLPELLPGWEFPVTRLFED